MADIDFLYWQDESARRLYEAHKANVDFIKSQFSVSSVNATATQVAIWKDPHERQKAIERMEAETKPFRDAMAALAKQYAGPFIKLHEKNPN